MANAQMVTYNKIRGLVRGDMPTEYYGFRDVHTAIRHFVDESDVKCATMMREFLARNPPPWEKK